MIRKTLVKSLGVVAIGLAGGTGGCALIPVAALGVAGSVADIGSAAFSTGTEVFSAGKLEAVELASFAHAQAAVRSTLNDLRLDLRSAEITKGVAKYDFRDDSGSDVEITLKRRTAAVCQLRVNVGYFGSEAYARLLLKSVRSRLPIVARRPATMPSEPVDLFAPREFPGFEADELDGL